MRKKLFYIIITAVLCFMAYFSGIRHTKTMTETIQERDAYIPLDQCIPLEDIACYYSNDSGYICLELKDIQYQMDDTSNNAYTDVLEALEDVTAIFNDRYVDMDTVTGYSSTDTGLMIYTNDGCGYYLEVGKMYDD